MSKRNRILLSIGVAVSGWFLTGFAYTTKFEHPISIIFFPFGLILLCTGLAFLISAIKNK
jgi:hypothetical protein